MSKALHRVQIPKAIHGYENQVTFIQKRNKCQGFIKKEFKNHGLIGLKIPSINYTYISEILVLAWIYRIEIPLTYKSGNSS